MIGSHVSVSGGMVNALHEARRRRMDCVQVFTANQRQWTPRGPDAEQCRQWLEVLAEMGWETAGNGAAARVVSHASYLTNLASPAPETWRRSLEAQRRELERCEALHIPLCVVHPGAHLGAPRSAASPNDLGALPTKDERAGLMRIVKAIDRIHRSLRGYRAITCLETTVGSGTNLGYSFGQLAFIRENVREPQRVGFCLDTCHVTAAGYDMSTSERAVAVLQAWDDVCGWAALRAVHVNDSIGVLGSRRDRHAHIGAGCCTRACFAAILNHPRLRSVPKILETPKGVTKAGTNWDTINIRRLKRMMSTLKTDDVGGGTTEHTEK